MGLVFCCKAMKYEIPDLSVREMAKLGNEKVYIQRLTLILF
jgi:hypothetical protein